MSDTRRLAIEAETSGWGCTFHRHTFQNEIKRDGVDDCTLCATSTPRQVYVFDPDFLEEHDRATKAGALREVADVLDRMGMHGADAEVGPHETAQWLRARAESIELLE